MPKPNIPNAVSPLQLWRTLSPDDILGDLTTRQAIADRIHGAVANATYSAPHLREAVHRLCKGDIGLLLPVIAAFPDSPAEGRHAAFSLRMTIVLWGVVGSHRQFGYAGSEHPLARGILADGLFRWAEHPPLPEGVSLRTPRHLRNEAEKQAISQWRRERHQATRLGIAWSQRDGLRRTVDAAEYSRSANAKLVQYLGRARQGLHELAEAEDCMTITDLPPEGTPSMVVVREPLTVTPKTRGGQEEAERWQRLNYPIRLASAPSGLRMAEAALRTEFPWMASAIKRIFDDLRLRSIGHSGQWVHFRPLLLVGPPGVGKSRFARRLAEALGLPMRGLNVGGSSDSRDLQGTARGWGTAQPSAVVRMMRDHLIGNPILFADELEKAATGNHNGRVIDTLLAMIEPETARSWYDECLCAPVDLSAVNWLFAANSTTSLPAPLMSRLAVIQVERPGRDALDAILAGIRADIAADLGLHQSDLPPLAHEARDFLAKHYGTGASIRCIQAAYRRAMAMSVGLPTGLH